MTEETRSHKFKELTTETEETKEEIIEEQPKEKKKHPLLKKIVITLLILLFACLSYANFIEPTLLVVHEYKIETSLIPDSLHGLKIVHFSDIHYGSTVKEKELEKIVNKINETNPDVIVFTGDLIDKNYEIDEEEVDKVINILKKLNTSLYKYAIYGDEDVDNKYFKHILEETDFKLLDNENTLLYYNDPTPIEITGFNTIDNNPNYTIVTNYIDDQSTDNYYKITLVHEPDSIDNFINYNTNLVLAGDSLGGLIRLPIFKPLFLNEHSQKYYEPYYNINNTDIYISNGLGTSYIDARFNNVPSINLYRLSKTN